MAVNAEHSICIETATLDVNILFHDIIFQFSTIWAETADNARSAARSFVLGGLSDKHYGLSDFWVADRINVSFHYLHPSL